MISLLSSTQIRRDIQDDHPFTVHGFQTLLEVVHQILSQNFQTIVVANHGFERGIPFGFSAFS